MCASERCCVCGRALTGDDIGATRKLVNRGSEKFLCVPCLAAHFGCDEARVREKIEQWRADGCTLFPPKNA